MIERAFFNIIIPTRERADTLVHCLRTVVAQDYEHLNIIVSDNDSRDDTRAVVESFNDKRITYINPGARVSMSHNWEFALAHVSTGWVGFVGDDDGLMPGGLHRVSDAIYETGCDAIITALSYFNWPHNPISAGQLRIPTGDGIETRNSARWLTRALRGKASFLDLPIIYSGGFAKKSLIDSAREPGGRFFLSMTPDVYSGVALACVAKRFIKLNVPVYIGGTSVHSTGASWFKKDDKNAPTQAFFSENNLPWHKTLVDFRVKSFLIYVYECYLQASHLHPGKAVSLTMALRRAVAFAPREHSRSIREYCKMVAKENNVRLWAISPLTLIDLLQFKLRRFVISIGEFRFDSREFGVVNVFDAAVLAWDVYRIEKKLRRRRTRNALMLLHGSIARFKRRA